MLRTGRGGGRSRLAAIIVCGLVSWGGAATARPASAVGASGPRPVCSEPIAATITPPGVDVTLELSSTKVRRGEPLRLKVTVRNQGLVPVPYSHGGQAYDFLIRDENGLVWLWSQGKVFTDQLEQDTLESGESRSASTRWVSQCTPDGTDLETKLPPRGRYVAQALWVSQSGDQERAWWSNEVAFRVTR